MESSNSNQERIPFKTEPQGPSNATSPSKPYCNDGLDCTWLLIGACRFAHKSEEIEWAQYERSRKEEQIPCKDKANCKHLAAGECEYLHTKPECKYELSDADMAWAETRQSGQSWTSSVKIIVMSELLGLKQVDIDENMTLKEVKDCISIKYQRKLFEFDLWIRGKTLEGKLTTKFKDIDYKVSAPFKITLVILGC